MMHLNHTKPEGSPRVGFLKCRGPATGCRILRRSPTDLQAFAGNQGVEQLLFVAGSGFWRVPFAGCFIGENLWDNTMVGSRSVATCGPNLARGPWP